jgi:hypothetical protein
MKVSATNDGPGNNVSQKFNQTLSSVLGKSTKTSLRRQDKRACNKLLRKIVDG